MRTHVDDMMLRVRAIYMLPFIGRDGIALLSAELTDEQRATLKLIREMAEAGE